ncbi:MAG: membrane protein insertase YidC [Desulfuromonadaceae bacterium]|nr:membrane protein insertase YidC [Desulfuromonadaceae bacterium]
MENRNTIIALVLMLIVWSCFSYFFPAKEKDNNKVAEVKQIEKVNNQSFIIEEKDTLISSNESDFIEFENDNYTLLFDKNGANIRSVKLNNYKNSNNTKDSYQFIDYKTGDCLSSFSIENAVANNISYDFEKIDNRIIFKAVFSGLEIVRTYVFNSGSYLIDCFVTIKNLRTENVDVRFHVDNYNVVPINAENSRFDYIGAISYIDNKLIHNESDDLKEKSESFRLDNLSWVGYTNKYFISTLIPVVDNSTPSFDSVAISLSDNVLKFSALSGSVNLQDGQSYKASYSMYLGPKDLSFLKSAGYSLDHVIDFGFFSFLAKPLHVCLNFFYGFLGNYGVSIILLTVIIKLLFWPLTQKSYVSMRAMQTLQPEMKKLREKYRTDREGLNRSMMELYKEHRVNPLGGCLPMFVQIPVFFALYKVLLETIELRHAPFAFWLTDLSVKDPYYITPVVMGVTMFVQQKMTPSTMDPMQAKMMLAMPVVFTFLFLNFPSGLVLYWLVNNLLTIFQQYLIYKKPA